MGVGQWMRVIETVGNLAQFADRFRARPPAPQDPAAPPGNSLEARLAGVVVAALREAFDRDRARLEIERDQIEAERRRAEQLLQAELRRQAVDRALSQLRLIALAGIGVWLVSAVLGAWLDGMRGGVARALIGTGWAFVFAGIGCAFAAWQSMSSRSAGDAPGEPATAAAAPWLLLCGFVLIAGSLLTAL